MDGKYTAIMCVDCGTREHSANLSMVKINWMSTVTMCAECKRKHEAKERAESAYAIEHDI